LRSQNFPDRSPPIFADTGGHWLGPGWPVLAEAVGLRTRFEGL